MNAGDRNGDCAVFISVAYFNSTVDNSAYGRKNVHTFSSDRNILSESPRGIGIRGIIEVLFIIHRFHKNVNIC